MYRARIVTPWIGTGAEDDSYRPAVADAHVIGWADVTGQPTEALTPSPNAYSIEATLDADTLAAIETDGVYPVLWSEEIEEEVGP